MLLLRHFIILSFCNKINSESHILKFWISEGKRENNNNNKENLNEAGGK